MNEITSCRVCRAQAHGILEAEVLSKYAIRYYECKSCGFVQTEEPYWLKEAYSQPIIQSDVGLLTRNLGLSRSTALLIPFLFGRNTAVKCLDFGAGNGVFVRLMRDKGFDFYWHDKYAPNTFAIGFEADLSTQFDLVTAFEVFEHMPDPLADISEILKRSDNVLFSTLLFPPSPPKPDEWSYYAFEGGQHVSFYTKKALIRIAETFDRKLYTDGFSIHLLTKLKISRLMFRVLSSSRGSALLAPLYRRESLLAADYCKITGHPLV